MRITTPTKFAEEEDVPMDLVVPGQLVTNDAQFMRGHGTYSNINEELIASVCGTIERVNKLVSVKPVKSRYNGKY